MVTGETKRGRDGPVAVQTRLGWVLSGPISFVDSHLSTNLITHVLRTDSCGVSKANKSLEAQLHSFWELESLGIKDNESTVITRFEDSIIFRDGRYQVTLPWKDPEAVLPDNYQLSHKRLLSLIARLKRDPSTLQMYDAVIKEQCEKGIVQIVDDPVIKNGDRIHYIPHHCVIRHNKTTTKLRVVYDASARSGGSSLNDNLHAGPKFNQKILDILLRFRSYKVALTADIEKVFLMIGVDERDRDVLRFLWYDNVFDEDPVLKVFRFTRVVFGVTSSPFLLNATMRHHLQQYQDTHPKLVHLLSRSTYVDDVICGSMDEEEALNLFQQAKQIMKDGGFNLRKFTTNSITLQQKIDTIEGTQPKVADLDDETYTSATLGNHQQVSTGEEKVLGVRWDSRKDQLIFDVQAVLHMAETSEPTKRHCVRTIGAIYDPMGILSPFVVKLKMLLQELCTSKIDWDCKLPAELCDKWYTLVEEIRDGTSISIPRCYFEGVSSLTQSCRLCGFGDASKGAYAAAVYLLVETKDTVTVRLLSAKTRVSPLQTLTIPRLELLATLLLARLMSSITQSLESNIALKPPMCWTDSKVALYWIRGINKSWKSFVQNRVNEIRRLVPVSQWRHCPGKTNPADLPSRGLSIKELVNSSLWFNGPDWLITEDLEGAVEGQDELPEECQKELKTQDQSSITVHSMLTTEDLGISKIIDLDRYSSLDKLLRVTAYVLRFIERSRPQSRAQSLSSLVLKAETLWIRDVQTLLSQDKRMPMWRKQFGMFQDSDGVLRCGGRLINSDLLYITKHPVLLPSNHSFTVLVVKWAHNRVLHNGVRETLTELRTKYWIMRGRAFVRKILHQCTLCRKFEAPPFRLPPPPPLPRFRVEEGPPFTAVGVDFAGPICVRSRQNSPNVEKVWIVLYTCCVVRAVHLDVVVDLSAQSFIRSFKRFTARRGLPTQLVSDNGKTFKAAAKLIKKIMNNETVKRHLTDLKVEWRFNMERAAWWGGIFERMIGSMKRCLRKMIGRATFTYEELLTAVTEVEVVVNSRPISYVFSDDLAEALTPSHLIMGRRIFGLPDHLYYDQPTDPNFELTPTLINKKMKHFSKLLDHFWKRWRKNILSISGSNTKLPRELVSWLKSRLETLFSYMMIPKKEGSGV